MALIGRLFGIFFAFLAACLVAGMIVVGARGNAGGGARFTLGGVASKLAHHVSRSLLIVRDD